VQPCLTATEKFWVAATIAECRKAIPPRTVKQMPFAKQAGNAATLAPCWYCSGLIRQFGIGTVIVGESVNFRGGMDWLRENGIVVIDLQSDECIRMLAKYVANHPEVWREDIGEV